MARNKEYANALIVKDIFARECNAIEDIQGSVYFKLLDLKKKDDRDFLAREIKGIMNIFNDALKELEG
jgi:hypothetical protein